MEEACAKRSRCDHFHTLAHQQKSAEGAAAVRLQEGGRCLTWRKRLEYVVCRNLFRKLFVRKRYSNRTIKRLKQNTRKPSKC